MPFFSKSSLNLERTKGYLRHRELAYGNKPEGNIPSIFIFNLYVEIIDVK